jgi:two-component system, NtrC family, response regulator PilR
MITFLDATKLMTTKPTCLIVDDEPSHTAFIANALEKMGIKTNCAETVADAKHLLAHRQYDLCLTDMRLSDGNGLDLVKHIRFQHAGLPIAIITAFAHSDNAVSSLKAGAFDYLSKPITLQQLQSLVRAALKFGQNNEQQNSKLSLLGNSAIMGQVRHVLEKMSQNQAPLLITGELGTGKESAARLIHINSQRREQAFIKVNCADLNLENAERGFFGYTKVSLQDPKKERDGFLKIAKGGTLFLDDIDKLPIHIQYKLLDLIRDEAIDIRFIAASHQDLNHLMNRGLFNKDFYYHINVMTLQMPALREIPEDITIIAKHLLGKIAHSYGGNKVELSECALSKLKTHRFLGNVRELRNMLERAFTLCEGHPIKAEDLVIKESVALPESSQLDAVELSLPVYLENIEKQAIKEALVMTSQNKTAAAKLLGVSFRTLRYRLAKLGLSKDDEGFED